VDHIATSLPDGRVIVAGGGDFDDVIAFGGVREPDAA
jgi:hypothetical protein